jgi:signal transduction histidine kinase/CheY-like chemotaxis protein/integral membrane sensor domain MASE1
MSILAPSNSNLSSSWWNALFQQLLVAACFVLLAALSLNLGVYPITTRPMWMPAALVAALIFTRGKRDTAGLMLGAALFGLWRYLGQQGVSSLLFNALAVAIQVYVGDLLLRRFLTERAQELWRVSDIAIAGVILGPVVMAIKPLVILPFLLRMGLIPNTNLLDRAAEWIVADSMAVWLIGPLLMLLLGAPRAWWRSRRAALLLGQGAIVVGFILAMQYTAKFELARLDTAMRVDLNSRVERLSIRIDQLEEFGKPPERGTVGLSLVPFLSDLQRDSLELPEQNESVVSPDRRDLSVVSPVRRDLSVVSPVRRDLSVVSPVRRDLSKLQPADPMLLRLDFVPGWALDLKSWLRDENVFFQAKQLTMQLRRVGVPPESTSGYSIEQRFTLSGQDFVAVVNANPSSLRARAAPGLWWFQLTFAIAALLGTALTMLSSGQRRILEESVSERTKSLQKTRDELAVFKALADQATDPIVVLRPDSFSAVMQSTDSAPKAGPAIEYANAAFLTVTRNNPSELLNVLHTEHAAWKVVESLQAGQPAHAEFTHQRSDKSSFWAEISAFPITLEGEILWAGFYRDLSDHQIRLARERELERVGLERERHEQLGRMAGGVAHDFNNLMTAIQGSVELIRLETNDLVPPELLESIEQAVQTGSSLTQQLLAFSGRGQGRIERLELGGKVRAMHKMLKMMVPNTAMLTIKVPAHELWVEIDPAWLSQVLVNLVLNSAQALAGAEGHIGVEVMSSTLLVPPQDGLEGDSLHIVSRHAGPTRYVGICVRDSGCGIAPALISKIFDPFYSTKSSGTGLGLAAVAGVIRESKGWLSVRSSNQKTVGIAATGSEFKIFLPESYGTVVEPTAKAARLARAQRSVLVVDDEAAVRAYVETILKDQGWEVSSAANGRIAQDILKAQRFDLLITDLTMPEVSGHELIEWLLANASVESTPSIVVMSGFSNGAAQTRMRFADHISDWLDKPFPAQRLIDASR